MGVPKTTVGKRRLGQLPKSDQMRLIGLALGDKGVEPRIVKVLKSNPKWARRLGRSVELMQSQFENAYPGQTRERDITNDDWQEAGYNGIANMNRALGIKRS